MEFLCSFLRRHLAGKPVVAAPNVRCILRLNEQVCINICDLMIAIGLNIDHVSFFLQKKGWINLYYHCVPFFCCYRIIGTIKY